MIEFMNAISPTFVAFVLALLGTPVLGILVHKSFKAAREERKLRYALEDQKIKNSHTEKMATLKEMEGTAIDTTRAIAPRRDNA